MLKTGFKELDNLIKGLNSGELITIASRPAMGKSTLEISIIKNVSKQTDKKILYFNLESSKETLSKKIINTNVEIFDDINTVEDIVNKCKEVSNEEIELVVVDYLQLISVSNKNDNRMEENFYISQQLKILAKELNVPVIISSQLSRSIEEREDKRPVLNDLRTIGIMQDSDKIVCLYSDDYYNENLFHKLDTVELLVVKNRNGLLGTVKLKYNNNEFEDLI